MIGDILMTERRELKDWPVVMTADEACEFLQLGYRSFLKLIREGSIPASKVGREWRVMRDDLVAYVRGKRGKDGEA